MPRSAPKYERMSSYRSDLADLGISVSPPARAPFYTTFRDDSEPEDDGPSENGGEEDDQMTDLGDELSRVIDRLIASTRFTKTSSQSQPVEEPNTVEQKDPLLILKQLDDRWQPSREDVLDDQDEIVIAPIGFDDKGKGREEPQTPIDFQDAARIGQPSLRYIVTCETESELSSSSSSSDCESVQATLFISEAASPPLARSHIPLITYEPAPVTFNSLKPGRSLASIMEDMHVHDTQATLHHDIVTQPEVPALSQSADVHSTWNIDGTLGKLFAAKSTTGATCGGSPRSSPSLTAPSLPSPPPPASAPPVTYVPFDFRSRPPTMDSPDTVQSPLTQPSRQSTPSSPYMTATVPRDGPRVRILEGGVTFPGVSSSSSSSWGTLTRSPTPGTANVVQAELLGMETVTVSQHDSSPLFGTILPPSSSTERASNQGIPPVPMDFGAGPATNLTGAQMPLPPPWNPSGAPWSWNPFAHGQGPAGSMPQTGIPSHTTGPFGWSSRQPGPMPWGPGMPPPPPPPGAPVIPSMHIPKTPWQGYGRPPLNRGMSSQGLGQSLYPEMEPPSIPPHPSGYPHPPNPPHYPFFAHPPPAPALGPSSLPWATSSLPQRSVTLPGQATPGMGFNVGYPWQTPGPITGFSPPCGPTFPSYPGWTPRAAQQSTGIPPLHNTGSKEGIKWDAGGPQPPSVSSRFSFSDATVCFSVQGKEYYVHRHFFEKHSPFFEKLLSSFPLHSEWPIPLQQVSQVAFERLLSIFYPVDLSNPSELSTVEEWTSILELSTFWDFKQLRARSIKELTDITSPIDRIVLAQTYNVPEWTLSGYRALVVRRKPVTAEEAERLGMQAVLKVWQVQTELNTRTHLCPGACCMPLVDGLVRAEFGLP